MIGNERQYRITKDQAERFEQALKQLERGDRPEPMRRVMREAMESQLEELREELAEYETLQAGAVAGPDGQPPPEFPPGALDRETLRELLAATPPLIEGLVDQEVQLQPNGVDLTLRSVAWFGSLGQLGTTAESRLLPEPAELDFDAEGYVHLAPGPYLITLNEIVHIPRDLTAVAWPRSSLLRSGVAVHNAVWDAGYEGRSRCLLSVLNPHGLRIARNARVVQMVFFRLSRPVEQGYEGRYQRENM